MDSALIIKYIADKKYKKYENNENFIEQYNSDKNLINIGSILSIIIGAYAAHLSYECNSKLNISEGTKIFYAVLAYLFGLVYLIYYFLIRYDTCATI